jgi:uncharacterized tellurite resistance protein B-like protein
MGRKKRSPAAKPAPGCDIRTIIAISRQHLGFAKLTSAQRRYLIAAILASVVPCDGKVLEVELQHYLGHLKTRYQFSAQDQEFALEFLDKGFDEEDLLTAAKQLPELLSADDRAALIGLMWDIACCDQELHQKEAQLIFKIADNANVVRKRALEEQSRAARSNGMGGQISAA